MINRLIQSIIAYVLLCGLSLFLSCDRCGNISLHFDFSEASIIVENEMLTTNDELYFELHYEQIDYLTERQLPSLSFISSAQAKCIAEGSQGLKHKLSEINFTASQDYDSTHLQGSSLNDLIEVQDRLSGEFRPSHLDIRPVFNQADFYQPYLCRIAQPPTLCTEFQLEVLLRKENGEEVEGTSPIIVWL